MKTKKFTISFDRRVWVASQIEIAARSEDDAWEKFEEMLSEYGAMEVSQAKKIVYDDPAGQMESVFKMFPTEDEVEVQDVSQSDGEGLS